MKVLHIINNLGSGGAEKLLVDMISRMNAKGEISADILLLTDKGNVFHKGLIKKGVKIYVIPLKKPGHPFNIKYIRKCIIEGGYDIVHAHLFPTIYWTSLAAKLISGNRPKFLITEHSTHNRRRDKNMLRYLEKSIYSSYDKIISISKQTQDNLVSWLRPKQSKLWKFQVIENGIDIDKFRKAIPYMKSEIYHQFTEETKLLCMVGSFTEAKDQPTLIKALEKLPEDVHLILVGRGPLKGYNKNLAVNIGVDDRVHFLGFRDDVERILKTADIIVHSSNWEGFGLAAVEGMAAGRPVISNNIPGVSDIIRDAGILFKKHNSKDIAIKVKELLDNEEKYSIVSKKCSKRAGKYDINKTVTRYLELYMKLV